jgi:[acyl-carrier-protein] S-malonyltransferase
VVRHEKHEEEARVKIGLFPGQGVTAKKVLEAFVPESPLLGQAGEILGYDIVKKVEAAARRPKATLPTEHAQPAIFIAGVCAWETLSEAEKREFDYLAGHSLGEYTALVAGRSMTFGDGLRAVAVRGRAMQEAASAAPGGMVAVMRLDFDAVEEIARRTGCVIANDNSPDQLVLAGPEEALEDAAALVGAAEGRAVLLEVSGAFHTSAMTPAEPELAQTLEKIDISTPAIPVISNVSARPLSSPEEVRERLVGQLTQRVRFRESLEWAYGRGVREYRDFGPGRIVERLALKTFEKLDSSQEAANV